MMKYVPLLVSKTVYRSARLRPRDSDTDFKGHTLDEVEKSTGEQVDAKSIDSGITEEGAIAQLTEQLSDAVPALISYLDANIPSIPIMAHTASSSVMTQALLATHRAIKDLGGVLHEVKIGTDILTSQVFAQVETIFPQIFGEIGKLFDLAESSSILDKLRSVSEDVKNLVDRKLTSTCILCIRYHLALHVLHCLGAQLVCVKDGGVGTAQKVFFTQFVLLCVDGLKRMFEPAWGL